MVILLAIVILVGCYVLQYYADTRHKRRKYLGGQSVGEIQNGDLVAACNIKYHS